MTEVRVTEDGGIIKKVLSPGVGTETPCKSSKVTVHYTGRLLDGTKFDSSVDRGTPFEFELGVGQVIKGWDMGVATMTKGEKALLTCTADYAYGASGSPPKIPGGATLEFEVELLSWNDMTDVTEDGGVRKKVLVEGDTSSFQQPSNGSAVTILLSMSLEDGTSLLQNEESKFVVTGDVNVTEGLEEAVKSMKKNEKSHFLLTPAYAYGSTGDERLGVPQNANVVLEVTLVDFEKGKESWDMDQAAKLDEAERCKDVGNQFYQRRNHRRATKMYKQGLDAIKYETDISEELQERWQTVRVALNNNSAAASLAAGDLQDAISACDEALSVDRDCVKALFRRAQAHFKLTNYESALEDISRSLQLQPDNASVKNLEKNVRIQIRKQQERERKTFSGIFDRLAAMDRDEAPDVKSEAVESEMPEQTGENIGDNDAAA